VANEVEDIAHVADPACSREVSQVGDFDCLYDCGLLDNTVDKPLIPSVAVPQVEVVLLDDSFDL
jgi:hypothetical protein